jgi:phosphatidylglycerol:prolipoprotein diacylglycerol transferase
MKKVKPLRVTDIAVPSLIIAQAIGRWGNFFNGEAHGPVTTLANLKDLFIPQFVIDGMNIGGVYYHPTFYYESLWCLLGFIILILVRKFYKSLKCGQLTSIYLMWYGAGRLFIESLRTDSLMVGSIKVAQLVSGGMIVIGALIFLYLCFNRLKKGKYYDKEEMVKQ